MTKPIIYVTLILGISCHHGKQRTVAQRAPDNVNADVYSTIADIPAPSGYKRVPVDKGSFAEWLRGIRLKADSKVYLYNGSPRVDQSTQYAVLDLPIGNKDLQQCADAIMRLRAEYFFAANRLDSIELTSIDGANLSFVRWLNGERYKIDRGRLHSFIATKSAVDRPSQLQQFLDVVFSYCSTISLEKQTRFVDDLQHVMPGDMLIKAGSPGHAMIVVDTAVDPSGKILVLLAQGFMPAQSIHIVKNLTVMDINPWYSIETGRVITTPHWTFYKNQLKRW